MGSPLYLAFGQNGVLYSSTDGAVWTEGSSGTTVTLRAAADRFVSDPMPARLLVMVGDAGAVFTSHDAISWVAQTPLTGGIQFRDIIYTDFQFMAVGTLGMVATSTDGVEWQTAIPYVYAHEAPLNGIAINDLRAPNDRIIAVGGRGLVLQKTLTADWSRVRGGADTNLHTVHYGDRKSVV